MEWQEGWFEPERAAEGVKGRTVTPAHGGGGGLDGAELVLAAGLDGAVAEAVAEVRVLAEAGLVVAGAAELLGLGEHVVDTGALGRKGQLSSGLRSAI